MSHKLNKQDGNNWNCAKWAVDGVVLPVT